MRPWSSSRRPPPQRLPAKRRISGALSVNSPWRARPRRERPLRNRWPGLWQAENPIFQTIGRGRSDRASGRPRFFCIGNNCHRPSLTAHAGLLCINSWSFDNWHEFLYHSTPIYCVHTPEAPLILQTFGQSGDPIQGSKSGHMLNKRAFAQKGRLSFGCNSIFIQMVKFWRAG